MNPLLWPLLIGIFLGLVLTLMQLKVFPKLGLLDFPERYGLRRARLPYPGGLLFGLASLGLLPIHLEFWPVVLAVMILGGLSLADDRQPIPAKWRLLAHLGLAAFVWIMGVKIHYISHPFLATNIDILQLSAVLSLGLTILWIVALQNAANWFDGLPGLSVGVSGVGFLVLAVLGLIRPELVFDPQHTNLTIANFYLAGLALGAWWFYWQGRIVLGDTGSQVLGFLLAVMAIYSGAKIATTLLVLSLPVLDFGWVIFRRSVLEKRSPFQGDRQHFHHQLAKMAGEKTAVIHCLVLSASLGALALSFGTQGKLIALILGSSIFLSLSWYWWWTTSNQ